MPAWARGVRGPAYCDERKGRNTSQAVSDPQCAGSELVLGGQCGAMGKNVRSGAASQEENNEKTVIWARQEADCQELRKAVKCLSKRAMMERKKI